MGDVILILVIITVTDQVGEGEAIKFVRFIISTMGRLIISILGRLCEGSRNCLVEISGRIGLRNEGSNKSDCSGRS